MATAVIELITAAALITLLLILSQFCKRRKFSLPPLRLPLLAALLAPIFNILESIAKLYIPSFEVQQTLRSADRIIVYIALAQFISWGLLQFPVDLKILRPIAKIIRDLLFFTASIVITILVIQHHFSINLVGLAATSAVLTAVIGLAAQETLKNLFAGISLELDSPFEEGDWVSVGSHCGEVKSLRLMTTRIRTATGETVVIPNSQLCNEGLIRVRRNSPVGQVIEIGLDYSLPPHRAIQMVTAILRKHTMIVSEPEPYVKIDHFGDSAIAYKIYLWQNEPLNQVHLRGEILEHVWYTMQREGESVPYPVTEVIFKKEPTQLPATKDSIQEDIACITKLDYFEHFSYDMMEQLMIESTFHEYGAGETVIEEGNVGDSLYVLTKGCLQAFKASKDHQSERLLNNLEPVSIVGEMSFYTGQPRSASVRCLEVSKLLEIKRSTMTRLIRTDPSLLDKIGVLIHERQQQLNHDIPEKESLKQHTLIDLMRQMFLNHDED